MKTTIYSELRNEVENKGEMDFSEVLDMAAKYTDLILSTDECLWGVDKNISGYGTWTARISFVNEYRFGEEIAEMLKSLPGIVTHDEEEEFSLENWGESIEEELVNIIEGLME